MTAPWPGAFGVAGAKQRRLGVIARSDAARRLRFAFLAGTALTFLASPAVAQTAQTWNGNTSTDWFTGTNWDSGTVPSSAPPRDSATLDTVTPNPAVVDGTVGGYSAVDLSGLNVGFSGTGSLTVNNGASFTVTNGNAVVGGDLSGVPGSATGAVVLDGAGTTFTVTGVPPTSGMLVVGGSGTGSFTVQNGATVTTDDSYVGFGSGSRGTVTVTGATSQWSNNGSSYVGNQGTGVFNVLDGATVLVGGNTYVGNDTGGNGTININGSNWLTLGATFLGGNPFVPTGGTATINVSNGGAYRAFDEMFIGIAPGTIGSINITGGTVDQGSNAFLGVTNGSIGTVTISGPTSRWDGCLCADMTIGGNEGGIGNSAGGTGVVNVLNGGTLSIESVLYLGRDNGAGTANGTLNISGTGSVTTVTNAGASAYVGYTGTGVVNISNGGSFINDGTAILGYRSGSVGTVNVDGGTASFTRAGDYPLEIGYRGTGAINVTNGGQVTTAGLAFFLGFRSGANGTITVDGPASRWTSTTSFVVVGGNDFSTAAGNGTINVLNGATFDAGVGDVSLGADIAKASIGTVNVSGAGSTFKATQIEVGAQSIGVLNISDGGIVNVTGNAYVGQNAGANGTINVTGAGSLLTVADSLIVGNTGSTGVLNILDGGRVDVTNLITNNGRITVDAGGVLNGGSFTAGGTASTAFGLRGSSSGQINLGSGTATLDGALVITGRNVARTTYTLIHSASLGGSVFSTVTYDPLLRNPVLTYTTGDLLLTVDAMLLSSLLPNNANTNQRNVAQAIDNAMNGGAIPAAGFENLYFMSGDGLLGALTQLSGEIGTTPMQAAFTATNQFVDILNSQSGSAFGGGNVGATSYAPEKKLDPKAAEAYAAVTPRDRRTPDFTSRWGIWGSGYGGSATVKGDAGTGSSDSTSRVYGMAAGAQYTFSPDTVAGFALGGAGTNFGTNGGSGRADVFQAGAYARHHFGAAYVAGALAYGWQRVTTDRTVTVSGTDKLEASFDAQTFAARLEGGYRFATPWAGFTPYGALQSTSIFLPSYAESAVSGSNQFALSYGSQKTTNLRTELGLRVDKTFVLAEGVFALNSRAAWAHDSNTERSATPTFQSLPGATFTVNGAKPAANGALLSAGAKMVWANGFSVSANFDGEFSNTTASYAGRGTVAYTW